MKLLLWLASISLTIGSSEHDTEEGTQEKVIEQYTDMPYPPLQHSLRQKEMDYFVKWTECRRGVCSLVRNNVATDLIMMPTLARSHLNKHLFQNQANFSTDFRVLIAGGGTGSVTSFMGKQFQQENVQIVHLDFSAASNGVARQRVEMRGLRNVRFITDKIENLPSLDLGEFDMVQCSGVLHHLPDPQLGLNILEKSLKKGGGVAVMVYSSIGRTGLYQIQNLMKFVNEDITDIEEELTNLWRLLNSFDVEVLERRMKFDYKENGFYKNIKYGRSEFWDNEAYDRLCHKQDRAYNYAELFDWIEKAGLQYVGLNMGQGKIDQIHKTLDDLGEALGSQLSQLNEKEQLTVAGLIDGGIDQHRFFARKINK